MGQPGPSSRGSWVQVSPGPGAEPEGPVQGHTTPFPRGPTVHSPPRAQEQGLAPLRPLPCTGSKLPSPRPCRCIWRGAGGHAGLPSPPRLEQRGPAMITGSLLQRGWGQSSFLAPSPGCSAFSSWPAGQALLGSAAGTSWVPGSVWPGSLRPFSVTLILVYRGPSSPGKTRQLQCLGPAPGPQQLSLGSLFILWN